MRWRTSGLLERDKKVKSLMLTNRTNTETTRMPAATAKWQESAAMWGVVSPNCLGSLPVYIIGGKLGRQGGQRHPQASEGFKLSDSRPRKN
jgi:hypothetical protein